ncbi:hypothetical protein B0H11DRAFT_1256013 [Mycena galericulata]|nr:hypothetical protein B0H11DRAFT_1256013 [Mycena galericulata]
MVPPAPSPKPQVDPLGKATLLENHVNILGIPNASHPPVDKSASKLSMGDMTQLGWRMLFDEQTSGIPVGELWDTPSTKVQDAIKEYAASNPRDIVAHIRDVRGQYLGGSNRPVIQVSNHYHLENHTLDLTNATEASQSDTQLLKVCLHYVVLAADDAGFPAIDWTRRAVTSGGKYPSVDLIFDEAPRDAKEIKSKRLKEAALISLLRLSGPSVEESHNISELSVERIVGSALSAVFHSVHQVHVISGQKLVAPDILRPLKSYPYPDLAAVRTAGGKNQIEPVVIIGEGKVKKRGIGSDGDDEPPADPAKAEAILRRPNARAQMAAAVHPTLILLVLAHYNNPANGLKIETLSSGKDYPKFDHKCMVYGIYYDEKEIRIYAHFPQLELDKASNKFVIRFYQIPVSTFRLVNTTFLERWLIAVALFCVQRHADLISDVLADVVTKYKLPGDSK